MQEKETLLITNEADEQSLTLMEGSENEVSEILYEDISKRSETTKHFRLNDGSFVATVYSKPIHTLDKTTGQFVDVAHTFEEKDACYEAKTAHFHARFPKVENTQEFVTMEKGQRSVSWRFISKDAARPMTPTAAIHAIDRKSLMDLPEFPKLRYNNIQKAVSMEYGITDHGVKESMTLSERPDNTTFDFELKLTGLRAVLAEDKKTIQLFDMEAASSTPVFIIPQINMTDEAGVYSEAAHYELTETGDGMIMSLVIDPEWLLAEERLYPVLIDPQVLVYDSLNNTLSSSAAISSNGARSYNQNTISVGCFKKGYETRAFLNFGKPNLPAGAKITSAVLTLKGTGSSGNCSFGVHRVTSSWSASSIKWSSHPQYVTKADDTFNSNGGNKLTMDISSSAVYWHKNPSENYGVMIKITSPNCSCSNGCCIDNYQGFYTDSDNFAHIAYQYSLPDMYADHHKYESFDVGRSGSGSVNLFYGSLSFAHNDVSLSGGKIPLEISHVYRSDHEDIGYTNKTFGAGWRLSVAQTLEAATGNKYIAVYTDAQGRKHYFGKTQYKKNGATVYYDMAGLGLSYDGSNTVTDEKDNVMRFTSGKLTKISDACGNAMTITYNTSGQPSQVKDSVGRTATFNYSGSKLTEIVDPKSRKTTFTYSVNNLTKITYPDGKTTTFSYSGSLLTKVTDLSGISYAVTYKDKCVTAVNRTGTLAVSHSGISGASVSGGGFTVEYRAMSTAVQDTDTKIRYVYTFDQNGRVTSSYEDLSSNTTLTKGEITRTDISEYAILQNPAGANTSGRYSSARASITGTATMHPNFLTNGSFNSSSVGTLKPSGWTVYGAYSGYDGVVAESYLSGYHSYKFNSACCGSTKKLERKVDLCNCEMHGNMLIFSAWAKASKPVNTTTTNSNAKFELYAKVSFTDGTSAEHTAKFDCGYTGWQYVALPIEAPNFKTPSSVTLRFNFSGNTGTCLVSNLRLTDTMATYTNNRVEDCTRFVSEYEKRRATHTYYDKNSDAIKVEELVYYPDSLQTFTTKTEYDSKHRPTKVTDYRGIVTVMTYDSFGNVTSRKQYHKDAPSNYLYKKSTYDSSTGLLTFKHDPRNDEIGTKYTYDAKLGLVNRQTDPNGQIYDYTYNSQNDLLTAINAPNALCACCDVTNRYGYNYDYLTQITHNGFFYNIEYDALGRRRKVKVAGDTLVSYTYTTGQTETVKSEYGNGYTTVVTSDSRGNPTKKTVNNTVVSQATYDEQGNITKLVDNRKGVCYTYTYNRKGYLVKVEEKNTSSNAVLNTRTLTYDEVGRLVGWKDSCTGFAYVPIYEKASSTRIYPDDAICGATLTGKFTDELKKDTLNRPASRTLTLASGKVLLKETYGYLGRTPSGQTNFVSKVTYTANGSTVATDTYTYDRMCNIASISDASGQKVRYTYDAINQLKEEIDLRNRRKVTMTYDKGGNITSKKVYTLDASGNVVGGATESHTYTYDSAWKDKLISYDGKTITYDGVGNPTSYRGNKLTWTDVRRLTKYGSNTFQYDVGGIRIKKNNTTYTVDGTKILKETDGSKMLTYYYGSSGVIGFNYKNTDYYYCKNLQGDVISIYNTNGTCVVTYAYDAWGKVLSVTGSLASTVGAINPFRYRSYYYDTETGLYYLNSRYYDPEVGRFINADSQLTTGHDLAGINLYVYCGNNSINRVDPTGHFWLMVAAVVTIVTIAIVSVVCHENEKDRVREEFNSLPEPTEDITDSFRETLKTNANTVKTTTKNEGIFASSLQFYHKVKNKGEWDLKQFPEYQGTFEFNGVVVQGQDLGNINFGYTGKALGLPDWVLLMGAGAAQIMAGTSNFSFVFASFGDDLRDQVYIMYGINLYKEDNQ